MHIKSLLISFIIALNLFGGNKNARAEKYFQIGIKNDVLYDSVISRGWRLVSTSNYGGSLAIHDLFPDLSPNAQVMIGAMHHNSGIIDVIAGATLSDITTYTSLNQTHPANGASWYFNGYSMGFAGLGEPIKQFTADVSDYSDRTRLSWHTSLSENRWEQDVNLSPLYVFNGWRSGNNTDIYTGTDWDRIVFTEAIPEPENYAMLLAGLGLIGLTTRWRRNPK